MTAKRSQPSSAKPFGWTFLSPLLIGSSLNPINSSLIATGLVGIGLDFHEGPATTASLVSVLYLCSAVMQPTMGKFAQVFGARRVFLSGVTILFVAGVIGTLAPAFGFLVLSRALIGVGTSAAFPTAMALIRQRADAMKTGVPSRVLGNFSIASQITTVIGLPLGGILTGAFGWRALFFVNVPLALVALVLTLVGVPKDAPSAPGNRQPLFSLIDVPGILLFAGTVASLLLFLQQLDHPDWLLIAVAVVLGTALILWEQRAATPLIDVRMLARNHGLFRTYLRQFLVALGLYTALYGTSQWMEGAAHYTASQVGLILLPMSAISIVIARLVSSRGLVRWPLVISGIAFLATGVVMLSIVHTSSVWALILMSLLFGVGNGFSGFANQAVLYVQTPAAEIGVASGLYRTFAYFGAIFSSSLVSIAFGSAATDAGFHVIAWAVVLIGLGVLLLTILDRKIPARTTTESTT
ncbi:MULTISPECIES: MFS transporter [unclassified Cryobacterium]|uniref:MFS transporter n=1 Tax=unclassified Cryobacterium TaxID=2649013 RepID=UPI002AB3EAE5|nr:MULTISPECIES: MFS transporter [unclassified Cryobacterium]MDY7543064.1 MFS transporter [Cryobacterium sp. 5B3]MEB0000250.1 MFS transporter [Cryobacterium sp. RTS3]MEB0274485.1 MFS transporter [Cryobacterium sp. 5B3]